MKKTLIISVLVFLSGCQADFDEGYKKGKQAGYQQGVEQVYKQNKSVLNETLEINEQSKKILEENQKKQDELNKKLEEISLIESLWKSVAYPDLVLTRSLIVNVPIFSVWGLPFASFVLALVGLWVWVAIKMRKRTKPTDDDLMIIEEARQAQTIIYELEDVLGQHQIDLSELNQAKRYAQQQTEEARQELEKIKVAIKKHQTELNNLKTQKQTLQKEIDDLTV